MESDCFYREIDNLVEITLKVIPNAKKTEAVGVENGVLKLRLALKYSEMISPRLTG